MKISQIVLTVLFAVGTTEASNFKLRALALQEEDFVNSEDPLTEEDPLTVMNSAECKPYLDKFTKVIEDFAIQKESNIAAFLCNPYQRKQFKAMEKKMEKSVAEAGDVKVHRCALAGEKMVLEGRSAIKKALSNTKECKLEVHAELAALEKQEANFLAEGDGQRNLLICGGLCIGGVLALGAATVTSAIDSDKDVVHKKRRRDRKLASALDYESIEDIYQACKNEDYSLFMYIENETSSGSPHINMVATPLVSNKDGCKDAVAFDDYDLGERLISYVEDIGFTFGDDWQKKALSLGTFALGQMKAAADSAGVVMPFQYDMLTDNCATFVIDMMGFLKIPINKHVKEYVVNALVTSPSLVQNVMGSTEVMLAPDGEPLEEHKEAMWKFVSQYIEDKQK